MTTIIESTTPNPANNNESVRAVYADIAKTHPPRDSQNARSQHRVLPRHSGPQTHSLHNSKSARYESVRQPVWFSVLFAAGCVARGLSSSQPIAWSFDGQQAFYTNANAEPVVVAPLGIPLDPGETLAVLWERGETSYSLRHVH